MAEKTVITLPDSWSEINVSTFQELSRLDTFEGHHKVIELVSILSNKDVEEIREISGENFETILEQVKWSSIVPSTEYKTEVTIDETTYYLIKLKSLTVGEWIDLDTWCENAIDNMHKIFAMLYRPLNEDSDINERSELFLDKLMISDVYGTLLFFLIIGNQYLELTKDFTTEQPTMN